MRLILFLFFCLPVFYLFAQRIDTLLLSHKPIIASPYNHPQVRFKFSYNPIILIGKTALFFYQKVLSDQIGAICAHEPSCSEYCRQSIEQSGFICGVLLSGDRLQRCTPFNVINLRKNPQNLYYGKIYDPPIPKKVKK